MKGQMILTVNESRKLIAKAILAHPLVVDAWRNGIVVVHPSATTYYVLEELGLDIPQGNNGLWICGHVRGSGLCLSRPMIELMMGNYKDPHQGTQYPFDYVFKKGVLQPSTPLNDVLNEMGEKDVYVKAVNAIDPEGNLGILLCVAGGGSIGNVIRTRPKRKYKILAATGLEKMIPIPIKEAGQACRGLDQSTGLRVSMTVMKADDFISEIEAFKLLTRCKAIPVACGGIDGMEGGYTFILEGTEEQLKDAWDTWKSIKGSRLPPAPDFECKDCPWPACSFSPKYDPNFSEGIYGSR